MAKPQLLLDIDGVLANFVDGISAAHNRPSPYLDPASYGNFDMDKLWGISSKEFWKPSLGHDFWFNLPKMPDADLIVDLAFREFGEGNVAVLTAPSLDPYCFTGKRDWMARDYPKLKNHIIYGKHKEFLAAPNRFLIDDKDSNVEAFRAAGGIGILLPRLWNSRHADAGRAVEVLEEELERYKAWKLDGVFDRRGLVEGGA